jgi:5-carboxymethyl-2-hydroxymuconate isomerase
MATLESETAEIFRARGLGLTVEVQEIDGTASQKTNNLHDRVAARLAREAGAQGDAA